MDRPRVRQLRDSLQAALSFWAEQNGVDAQVGSARYTASSVTFKMDVLEKNAKGETTSVSAEAFKSSAHFFGLKPTDLGRTFVVRGRIFKVTGLAPRSRKYPVLAESDGKTYKFPVSLYLSANQTP